MSDNTPQLPGHVSIDIKDEERQEKQPAKITKAVALGSPDRTTALALDIGMPEYWTYG